MKAVFIFLCALFGFGLRAQDQLYKKDNTKTLVKIVEVGPDDIKYKLYSNVTGPTYVESRSNVLLIVFENGKHEVINAQPAADLTVVVANPFPSFYRGDSLIYYGHANNISLNFFNFFNNEIGLIYQREFFKSQFNITIPVAFGVEKPEVTQDVYFGSVQNTGAGTGYQLNKKKFEVGLGINYYPSLRTNVNYYIGPVFRFMQYDASHYANIYDQTFQNNVNITHTSTLNRYCVSITNGLIIRTRSRLTVNFFGSLGFKNDMATNPIINPYNGNKIETINSDFSLFFWTGFNVGFNF